MTGRAGAELATLAVPVLLVPAKDDQSSGTQAAHRPGVGFGLSTFGLRQVGALRQPHG